LNTLPVVLNAKSPSSKLVVGSEDATLYLSPNSFTVPRLLATSFTLAIEPPTKLTLAIEPPTKLTLAISSATVSTKEVPAVLVTASAIEPLSSM
jgi:hypothetical protein